VNDGDCPGHPWFSVANVLVIWIFGFEFVSDLGFRIWLRPEPVRQSQRNAGTLTMTIRTLPMVIVVLLAAGCTTMESNTVETVTDKLPLMGSEETAETTEPQTPARLVAIWKDAVYQRPGRPPVRGFGGRIYFYDRRNNPIPVEGQLVVYGYEDAMKGAPATTPDRKFVFRPEQFATHFTPSPLGASYSVWLPWDPVGGYKKSISLIPIFSSSDGNIVKGEQSNALLPGKPTPEQELAAPKGHFTPGPSDIAQGVQPASYNEMPNSWQQAHPYVPKAKQERQLRTSTIHLPMTMTKRLLENANSNTSSAGYKADKRQRDQNYQQSGEGISGETATAIPRRLTPPAARFVRPRYPARTAEAATPTPGRAPSRPLHGAPQSSRPFPPISTPSHAPQESSANGSERVR